MRLNGNSDNVERLGNLYGYQGDKKSNASAAANNLKKSVFDMTDGLASNTPMYTSFQNNKNLKKNKQADNVNKPIMKSEHKLAQSASAK